MSSVYLPQKKTVFTCIFPLVLIILIYILYSLPSPPGFLDSTYRAYLEIPQYFANALFRAFNAHVRLENLQFIFTDHSQYVEARSTLISNWTAFLLYRNWNALIAVLIWGTMSHILKKLRFTLYLLLNNFLSASSDLFLTGFAGPFLYEIRPAFYLSITQAGTVFFFILLSAWMLRSWNDIIETLHSLKIKLQLSRKKIIELLILGFTALLLRSFIISFFAFKPYVNFLLVATQKIIMPFGFEGYIENDMLIGGSGSLIVSKHCLGFLTMFVFFSGVYLTRSSNLKISWAYIGAGLVFLLFLNIIRLVLLFIVVQRENGLEIALDHHDIYNAVIYAFVFILWVVWIEWGRNFGKKAVSEV